MNPPKGNSSCLTLLKSSFSGLPSQVLGAQSPPHKDGRAPGAVSDGRFTHGSTSTTTRASMMMLPTRGNEFKSHGESKVPLPLPVTKANLSDGASRPGATQNAGGRGNSPTQESMSTNPLRTLGVDHKPASRNVGNVKSNTVFFADGDMSQSDGRRSNGKNNDNSLLTSGRNTHAGGGDASIRKFTRLFDKTTNSISKKLHPSGNFRYASIFDNVPHNTPHKSTSGWPASGKRP